MSKPHSTLRPGVNCIFILLWGIIAVTLFIKCHPHPVLIAGVAAILGILGGVMQTLGLREARQSFLETKTAFDVRRAFKATKWGRRYLYFLWAGGSLLLFLSFFFSTNPLLAVTVGYFGMMFFREVVTLKSTFGLSRLVR